jgi:hypothetical protein
LAVSWTDSSGNLWLFGGDGVATSSGSDADLNDLWKYSPISGDWTWMGGSNVLNQKGSYGTQGTAASGNIPGARDSAVSWINASGNLWLFGGSAVDSRGSLGWSNDLWKYTPSATGDTGEWTWMAGSNVSGQKGVYGTLGSAASGNIPGGREGAVSWTDASGNLWLFGGTGFDSTGNPGYLNDLWKYTPSATGDTGEWTWIAGSNIANQPGVQDAAAPTGNIPGGLYGCAGWIDSSGNLWLFGGYGYDSAGTSGNLNNLWEYKP